MDTRTGGDGHTDQERQTHGPGETNTRTGRDERPEGCVQGDGCVDGKMYETEIQTQACRQKPQIHRQIHRPTDGPTDRQTDGQTPGQTAIRWTDLQTYLYGCSIALVVLSNRVDIYIWFSCIDFQLPINGEARCGASQSPKQHFLLYNDSVCVIFKFG